MWERFKSGMSRTRQRFTERMNIILDRGPDLDDEFWDGLEEALILSDVGASTASEIVEDMREDAARKALPDAYAVMDTLTDRIAAAFTHADVNLFDENPVLALFVGINGAGKTTTVGKIAYEAKAAGRNVLLGSADTFRAAAIEQLEEWGRRADVEIVERERGSDPASVCYDTIERAEAVGSDLVLIDTAGRLHTSADLMRELQKVVNVVRKRSKIPVRTVLVIDATTGQNGLSQAREFDRALDLDALVVTKLDGTAKGGIALAVSHELGLPIAKVGVGEGLEDLQDFNAHDFSAALIGAEPAAHDGEGNDARHRAAAQSEPVAAPGQGPEPGQEPEAASATVEELGPAPSEETADDGARGLSTDAEAAYPEDLAQRGGAFEGIGGGGTGRSEGVAGPGEAADGAEPEGSPGDSEEEAEEEAGRFRRMFRWRGRKK
jgi:fused signal recognition particle receptor